MITYVKFKDEVSIGGDFASITAWQKDKHGDKGVSVVDKGNFLVLTLPSGQRRRVPMSNIAFISEGDEKEKP